MAIKNYLTIDVEDYFHVSAFENISPVDSWSGRELRVERNTDHLLSILDDRSVKATFFVLGWVADALPGLVRRIFDQGHEVASHGYWHRRVSLQTREEFREDIRRSKGVLEDQTGEEVIGYRAPSYSITKMTIWAFDELVDAGYRYDSSIFPIRHDYYGISDWPRFSGYSVKRGSEWFPSQFLSGDEDRYLYEYPVTTLRIAKRNLPIAGGGYFRFFPYFITRGGLERVNGIEMKPFVFYLHPWEFDPDQPSMVGCSIKSKFRHYLNLHKTRSRFIRLLDDFHFVPIRDVFVRA